MDYERLSLRDRRALGGLDDSKARSAEEREAIFPVVLQAAAHVAVVARSVRSIDSRGLHVSNLGALAAALDRAAAACPEPARLTCLTDGFSVPDCSREHRAVVGGDATSAAIAAASVVAKVTRDRYMRRAGDSYPGWGFDEHVGYSTPEHREAIRANGISDLHRRSFQSIAYSQLDMEGLGLEGGTEMLDVEDRAGAVDADADDVEADLVEAARH